MRIVSRLKVSRLKSGLSLAAVGCAAAALVFTLSGAPGQAQTDQTLLARLLSRALSTEEASVRIGAIDGALSSNAVIRDLQVSDRNGVWLQMDQARLVWSRTALLRGRVEVSTLEIGRIEMLRRPAPSSAPPPPSTGEESLIPETPVKIIVSKFSLGDLALGAPVLGTPARLSAQGSASLGDPAEGLQLDLRATRTDAAGQFAILLNYLPQTQRLRLDLTHQEPEGGLVARMLDLPGLPPVDLRLAGDDPLANFTARLNFAAGPTIGAEGEARVVRQDNSYRITTALDSRIAGLVPALIAPILEGATRLEGVLERFDDGRITLDKFRIASAAAELDVAGSVSADQLLDVRVHGRARQREATQTATRARVGGAQIDAFDLDLTAKGRLSAPQIAGTINAREVRTPDWSLARLDLQLGADPLPNASDRFNFSAKGAAEGLRLEDAARNRAVGGRVVIDMRGVTGMDGVTKVDVARIETPTASLDFTGSIGPRELAGRLVARLPALAPFSDVVGTPLRGRAQLAADLSGDPAARVEARLDGRLEEVVTGQRAIDGALGRMVRISGLIARSPERVTLDGVRIDGANIDLTASGTSDDAGLAFDVKAAIANLEPLHPAIKAGRAETVARVEGPISAPRVKGSATVRDASAMDRAIRQLEVGFDATLGSAIRAALTLSGDVGGKPAMGGLEVAQVDGGWSLAANKFTIGSASIDGRVQLDANNLASGNVAVAAADLDDLTPLLLSRLEGRLDARLALAVVDGRQNVEIDAKGARLRYDDVRLERLLADVRVRDALGAPSIDGQIEAANLRAGGQNFRLIGLTARDDGKGSAIEIKADAQGFALNGAGRVPAGQRRFDLARFEARRGNASIRLDAPTTLAWRDDGVTISKAVVRIGTGLVTVNGRVGDTLDLDVVLRALPLSAAEIFSPGLGLAGVVNGRATARGPASAINGDFDLAVTNFSNAGVRQAGLQPLSANAKGRFEKGRVLLDGVVNAPGVGQVKIGGTAPMAATGALDLTVNGRLNLAGANASLAVSGVRVTGNADVNLRIGGDVSAPRPQGAINIAGAGIEDPTRGVRITNLTARLAARGETIVVESASARTPNGGTISVAGRIDVNPGAGFPADLRVTGRRAQLASNATTNAIADLDITLRGPLTQAPQIGGRVNLITLDITLPDRLPIVQEPLPNARHLAPPPQSQARLAQRRRAERTRAAGPPFNARLDLAIVATNRLFVRGRGVEAELGGQLRLTGTSQDPQAVGAFDLRRGRFDLLGQRIELTRGRLDFTGELTPNIDLVAETRAGDVTARIAVEGPAASPTFAISSTPDLPQDEVISRVLFQRAAGGLSSGQALQLAQAIAVLSGGSSGAFESVRRSLGVDSFDVTTGAGGGPAVAASRYISNRVRLGVRAGASPEESAVSVDVDITRRFKAKTEVGADGSTSVGAGYEWEW
ncbi:MAG: translocation/assembly module TamB domain-containing protein [Beijerinckiaceae bacterium]|nr:translocation/assembly module TamB domain-containing protein [Beijerinckiaceae bacterium]